MSNSMRSWRRTAVGVVGVGVVAGAAVFGALPPAAAAPVSEPVSVSLLSEAAPFDVPVAAPAQLVSQPEASLVAAGWQTAPMPAWWWRHHHHHWWNHWWWWW